MSDEAYDGCVDASDAISVGFESSAWSSVIGLSASWDGSHRSCSVGGGMGVYCCWVADWAACGVEVDEGWVDRGSGGCGRGEFVAAPPPWDEKADGPTGAPVGVDDNAGVPLLLGSLL